MRQRTVFEGQRGVVTSIFLASIFVNILVLTTPLYMLQLFSRVLASGSMSSLTVLTIGAGIAIFFYFLFDAIRQRLANRLGTRLEVGLGPTVISVLVGAASATDTRGVQPVRDLQELRRFVTGPSFIALLDAPWSMVIVAAIFVIHPLLGAIGLGGIAVLLALGILSELMGRRPNEEAAEATQKANSVVEEMVRNAEVVRSMARVDGLVDRWRGLSYEALALGARVVDRVALMTSLARTVRMALQIAILGAGVWLVLAGQLTPGLMIVTSILIGRAAAPVEQAIGGWRALMGARLAHRRLNRLLAGIHDSAARLELPQPDGRLSVEGATVVVPEHQNPLIFDISFDLRPGASLGVIGASGAGKTTLVRALVGLQPLSRGHVRIDDAALTDWPETQIGRHIGFLPQRVELFDGTIAENIATMDEGAMPSMIVDAARRANVHDLILAVPGGYNAPVGQRGELLSAGQRQRIGLARAFYGDKRLIVLDEPNANLDPEGEEALADAVRNATARGAVVVVVTHRTAILRQMTHAALLQNGRLARFGTAREVLDAATQPVSARYATEGGKIRPIDLARKGAARPGTSQEGAA